MEKGQAFTGGTIVVIDPHNALFNFLFNYVRFVNPNVKIGKNYSHIITSNKFGYSRLSTHFPELQKLKNFEGHYGIDIRYANGPLEPLLPANKQHILFGKLGHLSTSLTFIKFETYGLGIEKKEMIKHLGKAIHKGTKDVTETHNKLYSRREDLPKEVEQKFNHLISQVSKEERKEIDKELFRNLKHIKTFYAIAKKLANHTQKYCLEAQNFILYLENNYDNIALRRGNEVILDLRDFSK